MEMIEKLLSLIESKGETQDAFERRYGFPRGRISKWKEGTGEPTARQLWRIAIGERVPIDYFLDPAMSDPSQSAGLSDDERALLLVYRSLRGPDLTIEDAIRRMSRERQVPRTVTPEEEKRRKSS
jgi:transcriptional regulator with XRE-family HTH domain